MKTQQIGNSPLISSRLSYGCMRIAGTFNPADVTPEKRANGKAAVIAAFEAGYTLFDHADIYCRGLCEKIFGDAVRSTPSLKRSNFLIATKCGIRFPNVPPGSPHRPALANASLNFTVREAIRRSHAAAITSPLPATGPRKQATVGFGIRWSSSGISP